MRKLGCMKKSWGWRKKIPIKGVRLDPQGCKNKNLSEK